MGDEVSGDGSEQLDTASLSWLSATLASDAAQGAGTLPGWISARHGGQRRVGSATVVTVSRNDNAPIRDLIASGRIAGDILVVGGGSESVTACLGDLMAQELQAMGIVALVTDGLVRDSEDVRALAFDVWARGVSTTASTKRGPGVVGGHTVLGGVIVRDGDLVVADADGVVVWPGSEMSRLVAAAAEKRSADEVRLRAIESVPR